MITIPEIQDLYERNMFNIGNTDLIRQELDIIETKYNNRFTIEFEYDWARNNISFDILFRDHKDKDWFMLAWA